MKKLLCGLICAAFLSAAASAIASSPDTYLPDLEGIYWQSAPVTGEEGVTYNSELGTLIPLENDNTLSLSPTLLPEPIPAPQKAEMAPLEKPMIAIVIDDMGVDRKHSARAVKNLPAAVTTSYLAYSAHIQEQVDASHKAGHEVILHLPWEPDRSTADPGPNHMSVSMTKEQLQKNLLANLDGFKGYVGVNNHMGSKFSQYRPGVEIVMAELKKRGVFFLDSKTTPFSIAEKTAREYGVPTTHRDVFIDDQEIPVFLTAMLKNVEAVARKKGSAVAIGHPKDMTLAELEAWIPMIQKKGFRLVPLSTVLKYRQSADAGYVANK